MLFTGNQDIKSITQEIGRRCIVIRPEISITNSEIFQEDNTEKILKTISTHFYRLYLSKMINIVPELLNRLKDDQQTQPDLLYESSKILYQIFKEAYSDTLPSYIKEIKISDYFSENVMAERIYQMVTNAWVLTPGLFQIRKSTNSLGFDVKDPFEAKRLKNECPENLEPKVIGSTLVMNLNEAEQYFGIRFKKKVFRFF